MRFFLKLILLIFFLNACSQQIDRVEYKTLEEGVLGENEINNVRGFKKISYIGQKIKTRETFLNSYSKDSLGNSARKLVIEEYFFDPSEDKQKIREKYPKESYTFKFYFVKREEIGNYIAEYKENRQLDTRFGKKENYLYDKAGKLICLNTVEINMNKEQKNQTFKYKYDGDGNLIMKAFYDWDGEINYKIFKKGNNNIPVEQYTKDEFRIMKKKYFANESIDYFGSKRFEP